VHRSVITVMYRECRGIRPARHEEEDLREKAVHRRLAIAVARSRSVRPTIARVPGASRSRSVSPAGSLCDDEQRGWPEYIGARMQA